jgi:hypothetical protein
MTELAKLAQQYLSEASVLKAHIDRLRGQIPTATCSESADLKYRISILYTMYLECRHTGRFLSEHPIVLREKEQAIDEKPSPLS